MREGASTTFLTGLSTVWLGYSAKEHAKKKKSSIAISLSPSPDIEVLALVQSHTFEF